MGYKSISVIVYVTIFMHANFYSRVARDYARSFRRPQAEFERVDRFLRAPSLPRRPMVLDAGCGIGDVAAHIAQKRLLTVAIDAAPEMITFARERWPGCRTGVNPLFFPRSIETFKPGVTFDAALALYSLIHIPPKEMPLMLQHLKRLLQLGGRLLLAFHEGRGKCSVQPPFSPEPIGIHCWTEKRLAPMLRRAGFEVTGADRRPPAETEIQVPHLYMSAVRN